jgi:hypothetical protein
MFTPPGSSLIGCSPSTLASAAMLEGLRRRQGLRLDASELHQQSLSPSPRAAALDARGSGRSCRSRSRRTDYQPAPTNPQSACFRKNAGISISSMPLLDNASTFAAACERALRHTLGVFKPS